MIHEAIRGAASKLLKYDQDDVDTYEVLIPDGELHLDLVMEEGKFITNLREIPEDPYVRTLWQDADTLAILTYDQRDVQSSQTSYGLNMSTGRQEVHIDLYFKEGKSATWVEA